jgi:hypothetical protein
LNKVFNYFSLMGAINMGRARFINLIERGEFEAAMYEQFNLFYLINERRELENSLTNKEWR